MVQKGKNSTAEFVQCEKCEIVSHGYCFLISVLFLFSNTLYCCKASVICYCLSTESSGCHTLFRFLSNLSICVSKIHEIELLLISTFFFTSSTFSGSSCYQDDSASSCAMQLAKKISVLSRVKNATSCLHFHFFVDSAA